MALPEAPRFINRDVVETFKEEYSTPLINWLRTLELRPEDQDSQKGNVSAAVQNTLRVAKDSFGIDELDIIVDQRHEYTSYIDDDFGAIAFSFETMEFSAGDIYSGKFAPSDFMHRPWYRDYYVQNRQEMFTKYGEKIIGATLKWAAERQTPST